jgi:hypothetical protein
MIIDTEDRGVVKLVTARSRSPSSSATPRAIRGMSQGRASATMEFLEYRAMPQAGSTLAIGSNETHAHKMLLDFSSGLTFAQQGGTLRILADRFINRSVITLPSIGTLAIGSAHVENFGAIYANAGAMSVNGGWWVNHGLVAGGDKFVNILTSTFENKGTLQGGKVTLTVTGMHGNAGELLFETSNTRLAISGVFELAGPATTTVLGSLVLDGKYTLASDVYVGSHGSLELMGQPELVGTIEAYGRLIITGSVTLADLERVRNFHRVDIAGNLDLQGATLTIGDLDGVWNYAGTVRDGVIDARVEPLRADTAHLTLKNVEVYGEVIATSDMSLAGSTRFERITLIFAHLGLDPGMTLHGTIVIARGTDPYWPYVLIGTNTLGDFTIGEDCTLIVEEGFEGTVRFGWLFNNQTTGVTNLGTILVKGGSLSGVLLNTSGTIEVTGGASFSAGFLENTGVISAVGPNSQIGLGASTSGTKAFNRGSIYVGAGSIGRLTAGFVNEGLLAFDGNLRLQASNTASPELGDYVRGSSGTMTLIGTWDLGDGTFVADAKTGSIEINATIRNGELDVRDDSHYIFTQANLANVKVRDSVIMDKPGTRIIVSGTTRFVSLHMRGGSELRMIAPYVLQDDLYFEPAAANSSPLYRVILDGFDKPLTIAAGAEIIGRADFAGRVEMMGQYVNEGTHLLNQGVIRMEGAGSELLLWSRELVNEGVIEGGEGTLLTVRALHWRGNSGWIRSEGGTLTLIGSATTEALGFDHVIVNNGVGELSMTIDNTGAVLVFDAAKTTWEARSARILGGVVEIADGTSLRVGKENGYFSYISLLLQSVEVRGEILMARDHTDVLFEGTTTAQVVRLAAQGTALTVPAGALPASIIAEGEGTWPRVLGVTTKAASRNLEIGSEGWIELADGLASPLQIVGTTFGAQIMQRGEIRIGDGAVLELEHDSSLTNEGVIDIGAGGAIKGGNQFVQTASGTLNISWGLGTLTQPVIFGAGPIALAGTLVVAFDDEHPPLAPEHFTLAMGSNVEVNLTTFIVPEPPMYRRVEIVQTPSELALELSSIADVDDNGFVDIDDYIVFSSRHEAGSMDADFDGDGDVDADDFSLFLYVFELG